MRQQAGIKCDRCGIATVSPTGWISILPSPSGVGFDVIPERDDLGSEDAIHLCGAGCFSVYANRIIANGFVIPKGNSVAA